MLIGLQMVGAAAGRRVVLCISVKATAFKATLLR